MATWTISAWSLRPKCSLACGPATTAARWSWWTGFRGSRCTSTSTPLMIEQIVVLCAHDASTLYGLQGVNGAVLITTSTGERRNEQ